MFDAWNKDESWDRFEKCGSDEADTRAPRDSEEAGEGGELVGARQPRMICVGFAVFRI
jgi:hypothetical protein